VSNKSLRFVAGFVVILVLGWIYFPVLTKYRNLKTEEELVEAQIRDLDQKIEKLRIEKKLLESDSTYIEKVVRDELGLVKPGEIVYKFVEDYSVAPDGMSVEPPQVAITAQRPHLLEVTPTDQLIPTPSPVAKKTVRSDAYFASTR